MVATAGVARMFPVAHDYGRFSGMQQEAGQSKERQKTLADAWSERKKIPIDLRLLDEAVSGRLVKRRTDDRYDLARFLKMVESGRVQPGDYLLLENLDRLSREEEVPATHLLTSILMAGVIVVQLAPYELELTAKSDMFTIFRAVLELSRGHGESERKHQMVSASYASNRAKAVEEAESYQGQLPTWLRREGKGKGAKNRRIIKIPERVKVIKDIFRWAAEGWGYIEITRRLIEERIPAFGDRTPRIHPETKEQLKSRNGLLRWVKVSDTYGAGRWTRSYIVGVLRGRQAVGELKTKTGEIIPIPAAVTEEEWLAAQAGRAERDKHRGRHRKTAPINLFASLLKDAETEETYYAITRQGRGRSWRVLINAGGKEGDAAGKSFPEPIFEEAILRCLKEIDPAEVTLQSGPDEVSVLTGRLEQVRAQLAELKQEIKDCEKRPKGLGQVMAELEEEESRLEEERREAQQHASHPLSEAWGQAKSLLDVIETAEQRLRLRSLLRRLVDEILVLIVPRGWDRAVAVQMRFKDSEQVRRYLISYRRDVMPTGIRASRRKREKGKDVWAVRSVRDSHPLDLRVAAEVAALREKLRTMNLEAV